MSDENMTLEQRIATLEAWKAECDARSKRILSGPHWGEASNKWMPTAEQEKKRQDAEEFFKRKEMESAIRGKSHAVQFMEETHEQEFAVCQESDAMIAKAFPQFTRPQADPIRGKTDEVLFVDEGELEIDSESIATMILDEPTPEEIEWMKRVVSSPPIPYPPKEWYNEPAQPEIDWGKVAAAARKSTFPNCHWNDNGRLEKATWVAEAKAAVAEYLRQVKEGGR